MVTLGLASSILAAGWWQWVLIVLIVGGMIVGYGVFAWLLGSAAKDLASHVDKGIAAVKKSDWANVREEKKEIERMERRVQKKKLKEQLDDDD